MQNLCNCLMRVYLRDKHALAYFEQQATPDFWDEHWKISDFRSRILSHRSDKTFIPLVKKYLPSGSTILEGGCGQGQLVHALQYQGYTSIGIDFAEHTVRRIHEAVPELDVRLGDVRHLPIEDAVLDGYLSAGVIEHFWEGYQPILAEMQRVLKPGGFVFVSFPYMSPLRKFKARIGAYPRCLSKQYEEQQEIFYQFALPWKRVASDLQQLGFTLKETQQYDGLKGFKDEVTLFQPWLQSIYDGKTHRNRRRRLDRLFLPFAAHCMILVMQKI